MSDEHTFDQGYVCAVANLVRMHRDDVIAKDLMNAAGPIVWASISPEDLRTLRVAGLAPKCDENAP